MNKAQTLPLELSIRESSIQLELKFLKINPNSSQKVSTQFSDL